MVFKRPFVSDTAEVSVCSLFKAPGGEFHIDIQKMVLEKVVIDNTGKDSALHVHFSGLLRDRTFKQIVLLGRMVMIRALLGDMGEENVLHIHSSDFLGKQTFKWI